MVPMSGCGETGSAGGLEELGVDGLTAAGTAWCPRSATTAAKNNHSIPVTIPFVTIQL